MNSALSDRQRLKESDEILNSLNKGVKNQEEYGQGREETDLPDTARADVTARRRRGRPPKARPEAEGREGPDLNFGKYEIARKHEGNAQPKRGRGRPVKRKPAEADEPLSSESISAAHTENYEEAGGVEVREYSFEDLNGEQPAGNDEPPPAQKEEGEELRSRLLVDEEERGEFMRALSQSFEEKFTQRFEKPHEELSRPKPPARQANPEAGPSLFWDDFTQNGGEPVISRPEAQQAPIVPEAQEFMKRFADETLAEEMTIARDFKDTLAEKFMRERERYLRELGIAAEMDEKQQAAKQPEREEARPQRRKLDYQIVPEMHMSGGEEGRSEMVTYGRDASLRPQADGQAEGDTEGLPEKTPEPPVNNPVPAKKTSEQLLLELAAQAKAAEQRLGKGHSASSRRAKGGSRSVLGYGQGAIPKERKQSGGNKKVSGDSEKRREAFLRNAAIAAAAVLVITAGIAGVLNIPALKAIFSPAVTEPQGSESSSMPAVSSSGTATILESRNHTERAFYSDAIIKRSGVQVSNMSVSNLLIISDSEASGEVTLSDVSVDGAIHVRSCGVDAINLVDVKAPRLIINNDKTQVAIRVSGNTEIGTVELKTPAQVEQYAIVTGMSGIMGLITRPEEAGGAVTAWLTGLELQSLSTWGDTVLRFTDTYVDNMSCEGSVSLDGTGRVANMSIGAQAEGLASGAAYNKEGAGLASRLPLSGAADASVSRMAINETGAKLLQVALKGVGIANLIMKSPADMNISSTVDSMTVTDNMSLNGSGSVGSLMVNGRFGVSRLVIDIHNLSVPTMTAETEVRLSVTGGGRVNTLICNDSVYALGNKVNHLVVNADNCVYELEPDRITRAPGIKPPESAAENPNMDFSASSGAGQNPGGAEADNLVGTSCGHVRESGGFIQGDGSKSSPFQVSTAAQLAHVNAHLNSYFIQTADIDIADDAQFTGGFPVIAGEDTPFSGMYDGSGFKISNIRVMSDKKNVGLFGSNIGTIQNVHIASGEVSSTLTQSAFVGAVAGFCYDGGQILNSSNRARVIAKNSYAGGITGYNYGGRVKDCYNAAKIVSEGNAGGIAGVNRGEGSVAGCYNAGTIEGGELSGALAGVNEGKIINCYYLRDTAEKGLGSGDGAVAEKTSEELQSAAMVDEIAAGNEDTLWTRGTQGEGNYNYPVHKKPPQAANNA